jgi:hypothetical protein
LIPPLRRKKCGSGRDDKKGRSQANHTAEKMPVRRMTDEKQYHRWLPAKSAAIAALFIGAFSADEPENGRNASKIM